MELVEAYHRRAGIDLPEDGNHPVIHVVIENQIALGDPPSTRRAMERLMAEGFDRHKALHAVGCVLLRHLWELAQAGASPPAAPDDAYAAALDRLTAESWLRDWGEDERSALPKTATTRLSR